MKLDVKEFYIEVQIYCKYHHVAVHNDAVKMDCVLLDYRNRDYLGMSSYIFRFYAKSSPAPAPAPVPECCSTTLKMSSEAIQPSHVG